MDYYGKPVTGENANEPYAYIHIVGGNGVTFDEIVLSQALGSGNFENDNHSVRATAPTLPGSLVVIEEFSVVPEPSGALASVVCVFGLVAYRKRR